MISIYAAVSFQKKRDDVYLNSGIFCSLEPHLSARKQPLAVVKEYCGLGCQKTVTYLFGAPAPASEKIRWDYHTQRYYQLAYFRSAKHVAYDYVAPEQVHFTVHEGGCPVDTICFPLLFATTRECPHRPNRKPRFSVSFLSTSRAN